MKWKVEKKYIKLGLIALAVSMLSILFNYILQHEVKFAAFLSVIKGTILPIFLGFLFAYLMNPVLTFFEKCVWDKIIGQVYRKRENYEKRQKLSRTLGIVTTVFLFLIILIGGIYMVVPQVYASLAKIVTEAPKYYNKIADWANSIDKKNPEISQYLLVIFDRVYEQLIDFLDESIMPNMDKIVASVTSGIVGGLKMLFNFVLALIISVYVMAGKESLISVSKKSIYSLFSNEHANVILRGIRYMDQVFGGFINGKIIDSFIIGCICYGFMSILGFEYAILISIIIGVTNVIPYFGPFIGAIPSILILLMVDPKQGLFFTIFVIVLQQIDGNILGPIILGDRLNLSSMWILFAILIGGGLFGVPGMILGAPCFACIYALFGTFCKAKLSGKQMPIDTQEYLRLKEVRFKDDVLYFDKYSELDMLDKQMKKQEKKTEDKK